ncbi:unnamed protein product, partial [Heterotrigona itama]
IKFIALKSFKFIKKKKKTKPYKTERVILIQWPGTVEQIVLNPCNAANESTDGQDRWMDDRGVSVVFPIRRGRGAWKRLIPISRSETNGRLKGRGATLVSRGRRGIRDKPSRVPDLKSIFLFLQPVNIHARTRSANCVKLPILNSIRQNLGNENFHSLGIQLTCNSPASSSEPWPLNRHYVIIEFHAAAVIATASASIETSNIGDGSVGRGQLFGGFATPVSAGTQQQA